MTPCPQTCSIALHWQAVDCCLMLVTVTRPALLTFLGHCGTVPMRVLFLPCLPSPSNWSLLPWQGSWLFLLPDTQDRGKRGQEDGDRDWEGRGRLLQKNSSSSQQNAEYLK